MVSALPLPPKQRILDTGVLTSETPSPAPVQEKEKTEAVASPKDLAIPTKPTKPVKTAEKTVEPPKHVQPVPVDPTKAVTGDTGGIRIAQATMQLKNGTASMTVEDRNFGDRYAYYVNIVNHKVASYWYTQEADPRASEGKRVTIIFDINRDGFPYQRPHRSAQRLTQPRHLRPPRPATCAGRGLRPAPAGRPHHCGIFLRLPPTTIKTTSFQANVHV